MRTVPRTVIARFAALAVPALAAPAPGQAPMSAAKRDALLAYELTLPRANHLIDAMPEMTRYVASRPDAAERVRRAAAMSPDELTARVQGDAQAMAILKRHDLSARDYVVGVPALRMALYAARSGTSPNFVASPANLAFAKAHLAQLKPRMDSADGLTGRR